MLSIKQKVLAATAALVLTTGALIPANGHAYGVLGNVLGSVISGAAAMNQINAQIKELETTGRYDYFQQMKEKYGVNYEERANAQLDRVMSNLTRVIARYDNTVHTYPYNYFVNNDNSFNAFCTLGHNVSVNIGLFRTLNYNENQIAFVIGHELAHGTNHDPANGVKKQVGVSVLASVVASSVGGGVLTNLGSNVLANLGTAKGITLPMEKKADADAFTYCSEAGYNVGAGASVWQRIIDMTSNKNNSFNVNQLFNPSDHPKHINRRDTYSQTLTKYSNNVVTVDKETGTISINKVKIGVPAAAFGQSAKERAYMVAGDIAEVYHQNGKARPQAYISNGNVCLGGRAILTITSGDNASQWVSNLNTANK